ncbi:MAG: recombination regulator RecX [Zoogloeaceae bacterium]|jgi:regulatory protein|nr:recombination regulator RecX [Zoogloeaceae bacterium]
MPAAKNLPLSDRLRAKALRLLARREYSRAELARKLAATVHAEAEDFEARAEDTSSVLNALLDDLAAREYLSDARYAAMRVNARARRYGNARLENELRQAGVEEGAIAGALEQGEDENRRCRAIWQKKFGRPPATLAEKAKQQHFLRYRGFSAQAIRQTLEMWDEEDE